MSEINEKAPGEAQPGASSSPPDPSAADPVQTERASLTVLTGGRDGYIKSLRDLPVFGAWARQNGLVDANLSSAWRSGTVDGYPARLASARFAADGSLSVQGDVSMPEAAMVEALEKEFREAQASFPKIVPLVVIAEAPPGVDLQSPDTFIYHDFAGRVVMIHQRYDTADGGKGFLPWTRWSDSEWRNVEPDVLPFYGLPGSEEKSTLVIHEGAKAARRVKAIIAGDIADHRFPWLDDLRLAHHVGWIGGTNAVARSDWTSLAARGWSRVIIVSDNDRHGMKAARNIARHFARNVHILAFDQRFKIGFDCGDEWPSELFDEWGAYTGPTFAECLLPATQATVELPAEGRGRPAVVLRDEFASMVAYTVEPPSFLLLSDPSRAMGADAFNAKVAPFSHVKDTASKVLTRIECQHDNLVYHPGFDPGTLSLDGIRCFNVHNAPRLGPGDGDDGPWVEFLEHLIPDPDERAMVVRWLATLIARPGVRLRFGLLLISTTQGVGKNTLAHILRRIIGSENISFPSEKSVVDSQFNGWLARKRLIFIAEIYSGHSRKAYDNLKSVMADDYIEVNTKNVPQYTLMNWATVIACSNSEAALHLDDEDRRWLVPTVAERTMPPPWWARFYRWVDGPGAAIIKRWAERQAADGNHVRSGEHAPWSKRKRAIADASRSEGQQLAVSLAEYLTAIDRRVILRMSDVRSWIALQRGFRRGSEPDLSDRRLEKPATIISAMRKVAGITVWADTLRPKFGATREAVIMNFSPADGDAWADIKSNLTDLQGVKLDEAM